MLSSHSLTNVLRVVRALLPYKRRYWRTYTVYLTGLTVSVLASGVFIPLLFRTFIDTLTQANAASMDVLGNLWQLLLWIGVLALINVGALLMADLSISNNIPYVQRDMDRDVFGIIHRLSYAFFSNSFIGAMVAQARRFSDAADELDMHLSRGMYVTLLQLIASIVVIAQLSPTLSFIFALWGVFFIGVNLPLIQWKMRYDVQRSAQDSKVTALLADSISNFLAIKMFSRFAEERTHFSDVATVRAQTMRRSWLVSTAINALQGVFTIVVQICMLGAALWLWQRGEISVGTVVLVQTYLLIIAGQLADLTQRLKSIQRTAAQCIEMVEIFGIKPDVLDSAHPEASRITKGTITMDHVTFRYGNCNEVFHDFSLNISAGQRLGIVGGSGGGKTTLTRLLLRFADVQAGTIAIDGQDIRLLAQDDLRRHISYVPQDTILFHRSIQENIAFARPNATTEEIQQAAQLAHAHEFIEQLPHQYHTLVGERGIQLSGGERQRIAIARAFLKKAPILILDEATSSLDSISERYIQQALDQLIQGQTTIVIAHRLSTIRKMDRIVVLQEGTIAEDGTHEMLLKKDGVYAKLYKHQELLTV